jgi:glycosyltransferase involved in cell wall biosynthesis
MSPKVSIIVPVYNVETYLDTCVDSLLCQSLQEIEIILIDDGSQDRSSEMVDEYATKDSRIVVIHQKNGGLSVARNTGLDRATAPYVMFCDSDDFYALNMCEVMYEAIERSQADMAVCGTNVIYETDGFNKQEDDTWLSIRFEGLKDRHQLSVGQTNHCVWNKIIRRSMIEEHHLRFLPGLKYEDIYFGHAIFLYSKQIFFIKDKLINYRRRGGSIMEQAMKNMSVCSIDHMTNFFMLWNRFKEEGLLEENKKYFCGLFSMCFRDALGNEWAEDRKNLIVKQAYDFAQNQLGITGRWSLFFSRKTNRKIYQTIKRYGMDSRTKKYRAYPFFRIPFYRFLASISRGDKRSYYLEKLEKYSKSSQ